MSNRRESRRASRHQVPRLNAIPASISQPYAAELGKTFGIIAAKGIEFAVGPDHVRATAIDPVLVPGPGVHEWLDQEAEGMGFIQLELFQQLAERFGFAAAFHQVFESVAQLRPEKTLHLGKIDKVAN